jgi:hypothetical protein
VNIRTTSKKSQRHLQLYTRNPQVRHGTGIETYS